MDLTISWIGTTGAEWAPASGAIDALQQWDGLRARGHYGVEVKTDEGMSLSREEIERLAAQESGDA